MYVKWSIDSHPDEGRFLDDSQMRYAYMNALFCQ
jgi:hypothetical protein